MRDEEDLIFVVAEAKQQPYPRVRYVGDDVFLVRRDEGEKRYRIVDFDIPRLAYVCQRIPEEAHAGPD